VQRGLFDQQQRRDRDDAAGDRDPAEPRRDAGADDDESRDFGGGVDVVPARGDVARHNDGDGAGNERDRDAGVLQRRQPPGEARKPADKRERPDAAEVRFRAARVT
jgi:hypothetical protein